MSTLYLQIIYPTFSVLIYNSDPTEPSSNKENTSNVPNINSTAQRLGQVSDLDVTIYLSMVQIQSTHISKLLQCKRKKFYSAYLRDWDKSLR